MGRKFDEKTPFGTLFDLLGTGKVIWNIFWDVWKKKIFSTSDRNFDQNSSHGRPIGWAEHGSTERALGSGEVGSVEVGSEISCGQPRNMAQNWASLCSLGRYLY